MKKKRIVIVGGGFGGVRAALDLSCHVYQDADIFLVDKDGYHEYHPNFYRIATTFLPESRIARPDTFHELRDAIAIPLTEIIDTSKIHLVEKEVSEIDPTHQTIRFTDGKALFYDWLILALGSVSNYFEIEGVQEHALELKSAHDALQIRNAIDEVFSSSPKHTPIDMVIAGGGLSGCELAASLACYVKQLTRVHPHPKDNIRITILEAGDAILRQVPSSIRRKVEKRLRQLGVRILLRSRITKVTRKEVEGIEIVSREEHPLRKKSSNEPTNPFTLPYSIFIWTAGVKAHPITDFIIGAKRNPKSCLLVDDYLRVLPFENIFAIGDIAECTPEFSDVSLPMTAQVAISEGRYVAFILKRIIHKKMIFKYHKRTSRFIIPLGSHYAIAEAGWFVISGRLGWWLKRLVTFDYLTGILPFWNAFKRWRTSHKER
ncbi:MAG: FAD-dependent oxidoreductase [bacterium]|nr:FAD-dependent oxidoreductase [bacterium]